VVMLPHDDEQWVTDDGSAIVRDVIHEDQPAFPTPEDKADYDADGADRLEPRARIQPPRRRPDDRALTSEVA
ncbi:MAG: hypothetical protein QOD06_2751, partial [Candidatus Binatota bacterium]|nr:hypothetical protein [Candidatus Binatota bacterium]